MMESNQTAAQLHMAVIHRIGQQGPASTAVEQLLATIIKLTCQHG